jgi:hypothetical protein
MRIMSPQEFIKNRKETPHWPLSHDVYVNVLIDEEGGKDYNDYTMYPLLMLDEKSDRLIVQGDYRGLDRHTEDMPNESDVWLLSVPICDCRDILIIRRK